MGDKVKPRHTRAPGQSKTSRDVTTDGPKVEPHKRKRGRTTVKSEVDSFWNDEWDGKSK